MTTMQLGRPAPTQRSFGHALQRASLLPLIFFLTVAAYVVPSAILNPQASAEGSPLPTTGVVWEASYSERYPGCVSTLLWPAAEVPSAVVVMGIDGAVSKVSSEQAKVLSARGEVGQTIGVCRTP